MSKLPACLLAIMFLLACTDTRHKTEKNLQKDSVKTIVPSSPIYNEPVVSSDSSLLKLLIDDGLVTLDSLVGVKNALKHKDAALDKKIEDLRHRLDSLMTEMETITHQ